MRVLLVTAALKSHFMLMVPVAWALRTAGHDVCVASQPNLAPAVAGAGLPFVSVGEPMTISGRDLVGGPRAGRSLPYNVAETRPSVLTWDYVRTTLAMYPRGVSELVANHSMLDDLVGFTDKWRPDLVVWDAMTYTAPIAARVCGAAHVRTLFGPDHLARMRGVFRELGAHRELGPYDDPVGQWLGERVARFGADLSFDEELVTGQATIDPMPPFLRVDADVRRLPVRFVPYGGPVDMTHWEPEPPGRPLVCLTLGTTAEDLGLPSPPLPELVEAIAELDVDVIATATRERFGAGRTVPDNVRLLDFAPLDVLLPRCSAIVHHFGAGTMSTAVVHGVPQLRVSDGLDLWGERELARRLTERGAGLSVDEPTPELLTERLSRLLTEPSFAANAAALRREALAEPSPRDLVPDLEALVAEHARPRGTTAADAVGPARTAAARG